MKKKAVKRLLAVVSAALLCMPMAVSAAGLDEAGHVIDGSKLTINDFVEDESLIVMRGAHLAKGTSSITNKGNRTVGVGGDTTCHVNCDTVICRLYLEQKDSEGYWNNYDYWNYSTTNDHGLLVSTTKKVAGQHWYRVKGAHIAILNNKIESTNTITDGIWIS